MSLSNYNNTNYISLKLDTQDYHDNGDHIKKYVRKSSPHHSGKLYLK